MPNVIMASILNANSSNRDFDAYGLERGEEYLILTLILSVRVKVLFANESILFEYVELLTSR